MNNLKQKLNKAILVVKRATENTHKQYKIIYDKGKKLVENQIGDLVYYFSPSIVRSSFKVCTPMDRNITELQLNLKR